MVKEVRVPVFIISVHADANTFDFSEQRLLELRSDTLHEEKDTCCTS